jgi:SAM-dependent methyltransferase
VQNSTAHYQGEAGRHYHEVKRGVTGPALPWLARARAEKLQPFIRPTDTVFEYGVGAGWNLISLKAARRIGFDVSDFLRADVERHGIEFITQTASLPTGVADTVICHHALEHVPEPAAALAEMRRLLKPAARLLVWVPYERERRYRHFNPAEPNHHRFSWNVQTLANLVTDSGFRVEQAGSRRYGYDRFAAAWAVRLKLGQTAFRTIRSLLEAVRPLREVQLIARKPAD